MGGTQGQANVLADSTVHSIPFQEVKFHPHSFADPGGRFFQWRGQFYRGISSTWAPFHRQLFQSGTISNLVGQGFLVGSELTDFTLGAYPMVVRHHSVPFASYPQEWCPAMFKDAVLAIVDLAYELAQHNLTLKDAHPWNLLVNACKPVYVDLGSIAPMDGVSVWPAYAEFCNYCLYPLLLMSQGHDRIARLLVCEDGGVLKSELFRLAPLVLPSYLEWSVRRMIPYIKNRLFLQAQQVSVGGLPNPFDANKSLLRSFLKNLRRQVESINLSSFDLEPGGSKDEAGWVLEDSAVRTVKQERISQILAQYRPASVLDTNCGDGWFSLQAALSGSQVVAFDPDLARVTSLYREASKRDLTILPLYMDFAKPTPARGLGSNSSIDAADRFQCDLVLALDLMDHLTRGQRIRLDQIIDGLSQFTRRWLVLEYFPPEDGTHEGPGSGKPAAYTLEECISLLESRFRSVTKLSSHPEDPVLLFCEK